MGDRRAGRWTPTVGAQNGREERRGFDPTWQLRYVDENHNLSSVSKDGQWRDIQALGMGDTKQTTSIHPNETEHKTCKLNSSNSHSRLNSSFM